MVIFFQTISCFFEKQHPNNCYTRNAIYTVIIVRVAFFSKVHALDKYSFLEAKQSCMQIKVAPLASRLPRSTAAGRAVKIDEIFSICKNGGAGL